MSISSAVILSEVTTVQICWKGLVFSDLYLHNFEAIWKLRHSSIDLPLQDDIEFVVIKRGLTNKAPKM